MSTKISEKNIRLTVNQKIEMINCHISNSKVTQVQIAAKFLQKVGLTFFLDYKLRIIIYLLNTDFF